MILLSGDLDLINLTLCFLDNTSDTFYGGDGADTLIIEDKFTNRGIFGDFFDGKSSTGISVNSIDLDTIVVTKGTGSTYHVTGTM